MVTAQEHHTASDQAKTPASDYLLGSSRAERDRLLAQCALFEPEARWLLDRIGVTPGWRTIDVGCGPLGILDLLGERVGLDAPVTGLDRDVRMLAMARESLAERPQVRARLIEGDAAAPRLRRVSFDLAHARLLLVNVPNAAEVLAAMAALVRPGGVVAVQEVDWISWACEPPHPAWDRLLAANETVWNSRGLDVRIGRRLPGLLRDAGLAEVEFKIHARVFYPDDLYQTLLLSFTRLHWSEIVTRGILGEQELEESVTALAAHLADPGTHTIYALFCQAWGRKPA